MIRKNRWVLDRNEITSHQDNTIAYKSQSGYKADAGYGYFIQNHPGTLDLNGEWFFNEKESKIGLRASDSDPSLQKVQVAIIDELVHLENVSNVRFENIRFEGSNKNAFFLKNVKQVQVIGCDFKFNVQGWRLLYGKDAGSRSSPKTISPFTITRFVGSNQFSNGDFYSNAGGLYAFSAAGNITTGWSGEGLDGGSLKVSFNNISSATSKGTVIIGIGSIKANHSYVLKMSVRGANNSKQMELYLRKSLAPYNDISLRKLINTPISRKEISLLFVPVETQSNASIGMDIPEQNTPVYDAG